jgi:Trypsin
MFIECSEYKKLQVRDETVSSFVIGEPKLVEKVAFCNQNENDIGIASENEFPHMAVIKLQNRAMIRNSIGSVSKCLGSLISEQHVLTSVFCVFSDEKHEVSVELGVFNFNEVGLHHGFGVVEIDKKYGVTILKLNRKASISETVLPICLFSGESFSSQVLLSGWTGDWRECDPKLKKWHVGNRLIEKMRWQMKIDEASILNYRQVIGPVFLSINVLPKIYGLGFATRQSISNLSPKCNLSIRSCWNL